MCKPPIVTLTALASNIFAHHKCEERHQLEATPCHTYECDWFVQGVHTVYLANLLGSDDRCQLLSSPERVPRHMTKHSQWES